MPTEERVAVGTNEEKAETDWTTEVVRSFRTDLTATGEPDLDLDQ